MANPPTQGESTHASQSIRGEANLASVRRLLSAAAAADCLGVPLSPPVVPPRVQGGKH